RHGVDRTHVAVTLTSVARARLDRFVEAVLAGAAVSLPHELDAGGKWTIDNLFPELTTVTDSPRLNAVPRILFHLLLLRTLSGSGHRSDVRVAVVVVVLLADVSEHPPVPLAIV